jgi:hypothetical protein
MTEYRVTFGFRYAREPHPIFDKAHPDGWVTIIAPNEEKARKAAFNLLGNVWAFLYGPEELQDTASSWAELFPLGELHRIEVAA